MPNRVHVVSPDEIREHVDARGGGGRAWLLAVGQSPAQVDGGWADRVGVLDVTSRPKVIVDAWVRRDAIAELSARMESAAVGGWDVMFATSWRWAWGGSPFTVWSRRGWAARVLGPGRAAVRAFGVEREHEIARVSAEVTKGWLRHRVGLRTSAGRTIWIARRFEIGPLLDITYDGLNLLADASWASSLASTLASALEVPLDANDVAVR